MSRAKKSDILSFELKKVRKADIDKIGELVTKAKGDRSAKKFAELCGVTTSTMTRLMLAANSTPSSDDLIVQVAKNADPNSGVTFRMLANAQGYALPNEDKMSPDELENNYAATFERVLLKEMQNKETSAVRIPETEKLSSSNTHKGYIYERKAMQIIQNEILDKGFMVGRQQVVEPIRGSNFYIRMDFAFETNALAKEGLQKWAFDVKVTSGVFLQNYIDRLFSAAYVDSPLKRGTRITLAVCDEQSFNMLKDSVRGITIPDSISIMYLDLINERVVEEFVIPRFDCMEPVNIFDNVSTND